MVDQSKLLFLQALQLLVAAGRREDRRTDPLGELDRRQADAATARLDQDAVGRRRSTDGG